MCLIGTWLYSCNTSINIIFGTLLNFMATLCNEGKVKKEMPSVLTPSK